MRFIINIEKKYFYLLAAVISVLGIVTVFAATSFNPSSPLHPLQQISTNQWGSVSVDANSNAIIDNADKLQGLSASEFCKSNGVDCIRDIQADSITLGGVRRTTWPGTFVWSSSLRICSEGPVNGSELSGSCSPLGSGNVYTVFEEGECYVPPDPPFFGGGSYNSMYIQTCVDAG